MSNDLTFAEIEVILLVSAPHSTQAHGPIYESAKAKLLAQRRALLAMFAEIDKEMEDETSNND
jgi:hypothetical protein